MRLLRLLLAVSVALPLVLFAGIGWRERWEAQEEAERNSHKNALILHEHVLKVFDTMAQVLDRVDERIHGRSWREIAESESLHQYLRTLKGELDQIGAIGLTDPDGVVRNSSLVFPSRKTYVGNRADFREQRDQVLRPELRRNSKTEHFRLSEKSGNAPSTHAPSRTGPWIACRGSGPASPALCSPPSSPCPAPSWPGLVVARHCHGFRIPPAGQTGKAAPLPLVIGHMA